MEWNENQDLRHERAKMTALVEELELPLNVHRWRKLESSDPERYDLVRKVQSLQRSLVSKTESVVKKGLLIQEKVITCLVQPDSLVIRYTWYSCCNTKMLQVLRRFWVLTLLVPQIPSPYCFQVIFHPPKKRVSRCKGVTEPHHSEKRLRQKVVYLDCSTLP